MNCIYLSIPYTHKERVTMEQRVIYADYITAEILKLGVNVISPITHSHRLLPYLNTPDCTSWKFWKEVDLDLITRCEAMVVCQIKGWKESVGVTAEIDYCNLKMIPVYYLNFGENELTLDYNRLKEIVTSIKCFRK